MYDSQLPIVLNDVKWNDLSFCPNIDYDKVEEAWNKRIALPAVDRVSIMPATAGTRNDQLLNYALALHCLLLSSVGIRRCYFNYRTHITVVYQIRVLESSIWVINFKRFWKLFFFFLMKVWGNLVFWKQAILKWFPQIYLIRKFL